MSDTSLPLLVNCAADAEQRELAINLLQEQLAWSGENPDHPALHWFDGSETGLKIEDVREIGELLTYQPIGEATYIIILHLEKASLPAQQALLKMLEEPPSFGRWLLITTNLASVLPTIQSRCRLVNLQSSTTSSIDIESIKNIYQQIKVSSAGEAIALSEKYSDRDQAQQLCGHLTQYLHQLPATAETVKQLQALGQTQQWLSQNVNVKLAVGECFLALRTV